MKNTAKSRPEADRIVLRIWIGLNAFDAILTWIAFAMGAAEGNAFLNSIAAIKGPERMLLIKFLSAIFIGSVIWRTKRWHVWPLLNWAMVGVVVWNMLVIGHAL